jgi:hypothetical protein
MRRLLQALFRDESGIIVSSEIVLVGTILVLGSIVGLASLSHAVTHELNDVAQACDNIYLNSGDAVRDYTLNNSQGEPETLAGSGS